MSKYLSPQHYCDTDIFEREQTALFQNSWQFYGFRSEVENHQDFLCREVGGASVTVQNFDGQLKAFLNVCSHRFSRIRAEETGCGPLRCPYHGWTFDAQGAPVGIPNASQFEYLDEARRGQMGLEIWLVETRGQFIFVKRKDDAKSLASFLGKTGDWLERVSAAMGNRLDLNRYTIKSNWKIAVENAVEAYHAPMVHPNSFSRLGTSGTRFVFDDPHSSWESGVAESLRKKWRYTERYFASRPHQIEGYFQQMVFPNVTVVTLFGTTFSIQHFRPVSASETECSSYVFSTSLTEPSAAPVASAIIDGMNKSSVEFNRTVFEEDRVICELVQRGVEELPAFEGIMGRDEERVLQFQQAYTLVMADQGE